MWEDDEYPQGISKPIYDETFNQAWYVWIVAIEIGYFGKFGLWDWEMSFYYYWSYEWDLCPYYGNFAITIEATLWIFRSVTRKLVGNVPFVKTTNLRFLWEISFMKGLGYSSNFLNGKDMIWVLGLVVYLYNCCYGKG